MKLKSFIAVAILAATTLSFTSCSPSKLVALKGYKKVKVISLPEDAQVFDGPTNNYLGNTPIDVMVNPKKGGVNGTTIKLKKDGYKSVEYNIPVGFSQSELRFRLHPLETAQTRPSRVSRDNAGATDMEKSIIRWNFDSDPRGARIFYRVISSVPDEVKNTNETYLGTTPYEETRGFNIIGLTYENSSDVTVEIKVTKRGYEEQVKRFNVRMALDQQEIGGFFELVEK